MWPLSSREGGGRGDKALVAGPLEKKYFFWSYEKNPKKITWKNVATKLEGGGGGKGLSGGATKTRADFFLWLPLLTEDFESKRSYIQYSILNYFFFFISHLLDLVTFSW